MKILIMGLPGSGKYSHIFSLYEFILTHYRKQFNDVGSTNLCPKFPIRNLTKS